MIDGGRGLVEAGVEVCFSLPLQSSAVIFGEEQSLGELTLKMREKTSNQVSIM